MLEIDNLHASVAGGREILKGVSLDVKAGVLVPTTFSRATIAAPTETTGAHLQGPGWTLDLAPGWRIAPADKPGSFTVKKD